MKLEIYIFTFLQFRISFATHLAADELRNKLKDMEGIFVDEFGKTIDMDEFRQ